MISFQQEIALKMKQEHDLTKEAQRVKEELEAERKMAEKELEELRNVRRTVSQSLGGKWIETQEDVIDWKWYPHYWPFVPTKKSVIWNLMFLVLLTWISCGNYKRLSCNLALEFERLGGQIALRFEGPLTTELSRRQSDFWAIRKR